MRFHCTVSNLSWETFQHAFHTGSAFNIHIRKCWNMLACSQSQCLIYHEYVMFFSPGTELFTVRAFPRRLFNIQALDGVSKWCPCTYLKGQNKYLFWYLTSSSSSWQCFNMFCPNFLAGVYATHTFPTRQFAPKSETALLSPIAVQFQSFGGSFSRTERKLTFLDGFHGFEVVGPQEGGGV